MWPLAATIAGVALGCALGTWQLNRAQEKRELKERIEKLAAEPPVNVSGVELSPKDVEHRGVEARGVFDPRYTIFVDNRIHRGVPGYHVITPLKLDGSARHVLVNRGWIGAPRVRAQLPEVRTPVEPVVVRGMAVVPGKRTVELSPQAVEGRVWQNLTIERFVSAHAIGIQPFMLLQDSSADDGLVREWPAPDFGIDKHYGYAFQWFALAATLIVFYAATRIRRRQSPPA